MQKGQCPFRSGDKVALTGGAVMTVQVATPTMAYCVWTEEGRLKHGTFSRDSLHCRCDRESMPAQLDTER